MPRRKRAGTGLGVPRKVHRAPKGLPVKKMDMFRKITEETVNDDTLVTIKQEPLTDGTVAGNSLTVGNSEVIKVVKVEPADGTVAGNSLTAGNSEVKQVVKVEPADGTVAGNSLTAGNSEVIQVVKVEPAATDKVDELIVVDVKTEPNQYITAGDQSDTAVVSGGRTEISSFEIIDKLQSIQSHLQFMTSEQTHEHSLEYDSCLTVEGKSSGLVHAKNVQEQADKVRPMEGVQTETDTTERIKNEDGEFTVVAEWGVDVDRVDNRGSSVKTGPARKLNTELKVREQAIAAMKRKTQEDDSSVPFKIFKSLLQDNVTLCSPCDTSDAVNPMNQNTDSEVFIRDKGDTSNKIEAIRETASKFDSENKQVAGNEIEAIRETDPHPEIQASENSDENKEISQPRVKMVTVSTQYEEDTTNFKSKDHVGRKDCDCGSMESEIPTMPPQAHETLRSRRRTRRPQRFGEYLIEESDDKNESDPELDMDRYDDDDDDDNDETYKPSRPEQESDDSDGSLSSVEDSEAEMESLKKLTKGAISNGSAKSKPERTASSNSSIVNENMNNNCLEPEKSPTLRNHYRKFTEIQKATVKEYAKIHGIRAAAKHFSIPKSTVGQWMKVNFRYNPKTGHLSKKTYKVRNKMDLQYDGVAITNISTKPANENDSEAANNESINSESESTNTNEKLESVNYKDTLFSDNKAVYGESNKSDSVCPTTCEQLESSIVEATHYSQSTKTCENLESEISKATPGGSTFINERINSSSENTGPDNENQKSQCFLGSAAYSNETLTVSEKAISFSLNPDSEIPNESAKSLADELNCSCINLESKSISCIVASPNERINSVSENADSQCENLDSEIAQSLLGHTAYADFHCEQTDCDCKQLESVVSKHLLIFKESQKKAVEEYAKIHGIKATTKHFNITASGVIRRKTDLNDNLRYPKKGHLLRSSCPGIKDKNLDIGIDSGNAASSHRSSSSVCDNVESDGKSVKSKTAPTRLGHYKQFTKAQKLAVKEYAKVQGIRAAARKFSIPRSTVYTWNKREFSNDNLRNSKTGRPLSYDKSLDLKILAHVQKQQDNQIPITTKDICSYARKVVKPFTPGFKASLRWASLFIKRHNLCLGKKYLECSGASISNMDIKPANASPVKHSVRKRYAKRKRLTLMQKLLVKQYAQVHGIEQAAIHFKVSKEMVKIWNRTDFSDKRRSCKTGNLPRPGRPRKDKGNCSCDTQAGTNKSIKSESESTNTDKNLDSLIAEDTHLSDSVAATVDSIKYESERPNTDEQFELLTAEDTHFSESKKTCEKLEFEITGATLGQSTFINNRGTSSIERTDHDNKNHQKTIRSMCSTTASTNEISISVSEKANNSNEILKNNLATTVLYSTASPDESTKYEKVNSSIAHLESDFISCYAESPEGRKESTAIYLGSDSVVYRAASQKEQMNSVSENTNSNCENLESRITSNRLWRNKKFTKMQKSTVVEYAKMHGIRSTAKHFGVPFSTVYLWYKSDSSDDRARNAHVQRRSCSSYDKSLDFVILAHVLEQQDCQIPVTRKDLCSYARKIVRPVFKGFGATKRWASAFIKRHNLCLSPEVVSTIHEPKSFTKMQKKFVLTPREPYTNFTLSQKLAVKDYAKIHGIPAAMKHFGVAKSTVYTWNKIDFSNDNSRNCKNGQLERRGRPLKYDAGLDLIILAHVLEQQDRQIPITRKDLCSYARKIVTPVYPEFRGTSKWASAFIKRHNLCLSPEVGPTTHDHYRHLIKRRNSLVSTPRGEHYSKFTLSQKLDVKDYAQKHGIPAAMKHFGVPKSTVHTWNKIDFSDDNARNSKTGHLPGSGRRLTYDEGLDFVILAHVLEQQDRQIPVTRKDLCLYARKIVKPVCPGFEASYRWATGFEKRHNICLHKRYMAKEST